jgi:two-component system sensor histidine kinase ArlS
VIQGYTDLLDRWGKNDQQVLQESLDVIKKETAYMAVMIEKMLFWSGGQRG